MFQIKDGSAKMGKKSGNIAPMAYCVFQQENKILLIEDREMSKERICYRPPGGEVGFGEYSWETIRRTVKNLLGEEVKNLSFLGGPSEVVTQHKEGLRHEIVFLFTGELDEAKRGSLDAVMKQENQPHIWKSIRELKKEKIKLYPEELLDLLEEN